MTCYEYLIFDMTVMIPLLGPLLDGYITVERSHPSRARIRNELPRRNWIPSGAPGEAIRFESVLPSGFIKHGWLENPLRMEVLMGESPISMVHFPASHV